MDPGGLIAGLVMVLGTGAASWDILAQRRRSWRQIAQRLGASYRPQGLLFIPPSHTIAGELEGVPVTVDLSSQRTEPLSHPGMCTRVSVMGRGLGRGRLCATAGRVDRLARASGGHDLAVGTRERDRVVQVAAEVPAQARAWLDEPVLDVLLACPRWLLAIDGPAITLTCPDFITDVDEVVAAVRAAIVVAGAGSRWRARWDATAARLGASGVDDLRYEVRRGGMRASMDVAGDASATLLRVELPRVDGLELAIVRDAAEAPRKLLPVSAGDYVLRANDPEAARARVSAPILALLAEVRPRRVIIEGDLASVVLDGAEPDEARVRAALMLLEALAPRAADSPYR